MNIFEGDKRAQGATEYLLMLAAVLVVVAVAVSMLMGMGPNMEATGTVTVDSNDDGDIIVNTSDVIISPEDVTVENMILVSSGGSQYTFEGVNLADKFVYNDNSNATFSADDVDTVTFVSSEGYRANLKAI